jgi:hypothetical protein
VIILVLLAFTAVAVLLTTTGRRGSRAYAVVSALPLLVTTAIPMSLTDRELILEVSRFGLGLSFLLLAVGAVLTVRAARLGDRIGAIWLGAETVVASVPAAIVTVYYIATCLV